MARAPDARAEQARKLFLSGKKLIEIAQLLGVPEGTIRSWKNRYKWDSNRNATLQKPKRNVAKHKGGQPGNQNASGHGGTGPPGNKNAVTTGEFEALLFDCLNDEERRLVESVPEDKHTLQFQEIQLLTVRERRMLKRIEAIKESVEPLENGEPAEEMTLVSVEISEKDEKKKYEGKLGQIQAIEEALTRVQARKQRSIESLHKFGFDDAQIELERKRVEIAARAAGEAENEEEPDDGFLEALSGSGDWKEWNQKDEEEDPDI